MLVESSSARLERSPQSELTSQRLGLFFVRLRRVDASYLLAVVSRRRVRKYRGVAVQDRSPTRLTVERAKLAQLSSTGSATLQ